MPISVDVVVICSDLFVQPFYTRKTFKNVISTKTDSLDSIHLVQYQSKHCYSHSDHSRDT